MAQETFFRVHRIDDQMVLRVCREVMTVFNECNPTCNIHIIPNLSIPINEIEEDETAGRYSFYIASVQVNIDQNITFTMRFSRQIRGDGGEVASALYNEFKCSYGRDANHWNEHREKIIRVQAIIGNVDLPPIGGAEAGQEGVLRELLVGFGAQHRSMLESLDRSIMEAENRRKELDAENAKKEEERRSAHEAELAELEKQRGELERQSHMAERRKLLRELTEATGNRVQRSIAPRGAIVARWGVFATSLVIAGITAWLAVTSFSTLGAPVLVGETYVPKETHDTLDWVVLIRAIIFSIISVGALIYAAAWLRGFYNADLAAAREIERFTYDLNRASWVIETILEVQQEKKGDVPDAWVDGVTRGLFDDRHKDAPDEAAQALSALLGFTASASFGPEGPKIELNRRGAQRLAKAMKAAEE